MKLSDKKVIPLAGPGSRKRRKKPSADDRLARAGPCPVQPLGHDRGCYWYITPSGQVRDLADRQHREQQLDALFDGDVGWPCAAFTKHNNSGDPIGYKEGDLRRYLMRGCAEQGFFNPERSLRGPGVWRDDDYGLIVHTGDKLRVDGKWFDAGKRIDAFIYPAGPAETRPAREAATAADAAALHDTLGTWKWLAPKEAPRLLLGWIAQGYLPGALDWRSNVWVTGDKYTGKSWNCNLIHGLFGTLVLHASEASSAGVRQLLGGAARPVVLDEIEPDPSNSRARDIVALARLGSTEGQGPVVRGTSEGRAQRWPIRACFYFSSIYYPQFLPQDASRTCVLELGRMESDVAAAKEVQKRIRTFGKMGTRFYARMIQGWSRLAPNLEAFDAAIGSLGRQSRVRMQVGTLLACAETMLSDEPIPLRKAVKMVADMDIAAVADKHPEEDSELCLNHLYSSAPPDWRSGRRETIGEVLERALAGREHETLLALKAIGLKLVGDDFTDWKGGRAHMIWLAVAYHHQGLERVFADTRWVGGVWVQSFKRLPGARLADAPMRFAGAKTRAVVIPYRSCRDGQPMAEED